MGNSGNVIFLEINLDDDEVARILRENRENVNIRNQLGFAPLHTAVHAGYTQMVKILLKNEANIDAKSSWGSTALHAAVQQGNFENFSFAFESSYWSFILKKKKRISIFDSDDEDLVEILLKNGADVNVKENCGETPLFVAARNGWNFTLKNPHSFVFFFK